jgi:hypothetical protein
VQNFIVSMNGPAELKEAGDPFVYCAEGPSLGSSTQANPSFNPDNTDPKNTSITTPGPYPPNEYTYNGAQTNHPQWTGVPYTNNTSLAPIGPTYCGVPTGGTKPGNPDQQPSGYSSSLTANTDHPGGYSYRIDVGPTVTGASVWVYNPAYIPQDANTSPTPLDRFLDHGTSIGVNYCGGPCEPTYYQGPMGEGIANRYDGVHHDAPLFFFDIHISLYKVQGDYDRSSDGTPIFQGEYDAYDATSADLSAHGCTSGQLYDPNWGKKQGGADTPNTYHNKGTLVQGSGCKAPGDPTYINELGLQCRLQWCKVSPSGVGGIGPGAYRLTIEAVGEPSVGVNSITGQKDYASGYQDGYGSHAYAVAACDSDTVTSAFGSAGCKDGSFGSGQYKNPQVVVSSWNNTDMTFQGALAARTPNKNYPQTACVTSAGTPYACLDAGCIPTAYAGRTITLGIFNLAGLTAETSTGVAASGNLYVGVVPPAGGGTVTYPPEAQSGLITVDGVPAVPVLVSAVRPARLKMPRVIVRPA